MRRFPVAALFLVISVGFASHAAEEPSVTLTGYSNQNAQTERQWEEKFQAIPQAANLRAYMKRLSAYPHNVGSPYDKSNAEWILSEFKSWGLDAHIETFYVLFPTPKERRVELVAPTHFTARLQEPTVPVDPTSDQHSMQIPTYNAYSADGDVTGPLVYVNLGRPQDYETLVRMGISVKGAIVIARYGSIWRGLKPKLAAEHGAIGCLIYSDPHEDGYFQGDTFPKGPYRPLEGVQRGSVNDIIQYPGDPETPGWGSTKGARRLALNQVKTLTQIPVLPISYGDAKPLLAAITGPVAPGDWRGALGITYHIGPGPARVHLVVKADWKVRPVYDVIAKIPGSVFPDEWIIRGNHHDAWVNGAGDPVSGQMCVLEEARALGELLKQGWKPKRTIIYCAWDGEEPGLLGSTEWAETHADELKQHAAVYLNTDMNGKGVLYMGGSHTLEHFANGVAKDVPDPEKKMSEWQRARDSAIRNARSAAQRNAIRQRPDLRIDALGSGSDYSAFLDHLGIASLVLSYEGEYPGAGVYHSIYDDFYWYTHFGDPSFVYGVGMSRTVGTAVMRLADADVIPFQFADFTDTIRMYIHQLQDLVQNERQQAIETNRQLDEGIFSATTNPLQPLMPPPQQSIAPFLNFAPLQNGLAALQRSTQHYQQAMKSAEANAGTALSDDSLRQVNQLLIETERKLTNPDGLPGRKWYKNEIYAPGVATGYDVKTIPAVREAIEQKKWDVAETQIGVVGKILQDEAEAIDRAAVALAGAVGRQE